MDKHRTSGGVGHESPSNHRSDSSPKLQQRVTEWTSVGVPLGVVELQDEPFFDHHLFNKHI